MPARYSRRPGPPATPSPSPAPDSSAPLHLEERAGWGRRLGGRPRSPGQGVSRNSTWPWALAIVQAAAAGLRWATTSLTSISCFTRSRPHEGRVPSIARRSKRPATSAHRRCVGDRRSPHLRGHIMSGSARHRAAASTTRSPTITADLALRTVRFCSRSVIFLGRAIGTAGFRCLAIFSGHRFGPALLRTGSGYRCQPPAVESPPVSTSQSRAAASPDDLAVTAERCAAQLLRGDPAGSAEEVAGRLLAIQAQDPRGARLAIRARSAGLSASDVDSALARGVR